MLLLRPLELWLCPVNKAMAVVVHISFLADMGGRKCIT
jgi:hypothetical protein